MVKTYNDAEAAGGSGKTIGFTDFGDDADNNMMLTTLTLRRSTGGKAPRKQTHAHVNTRARTALRSVWMSPAMSAHRSVTLNALPIALSGPVYDCTTAGAAPMTTVAMPIHPASFRRASKPEAYCSTYGWQGAVSATQTAASCYADHSAANPRTFCVAACRRPG